MQVAINDIKHIYFTGIGGIGMSALARFFLANGKQVSGYDKTPSPLTRELESSGILISYVDDPSAIPGGVDTVVYTPAIPADSRILAHFRSNGFELYKRSDILGIISAGGYNICVAGTHGKTTISTMIAHLLRDSGHGCNAFLGGIAANYQSNFWSYEGRVNVIEADEYDRSFLKLQPDLAVITAMDADHLDIYGTPVAMEEAFLQFTSLIRDGGVLYYSKGLRREADFRAPEQLSYTAGVVDADYRAINQRAGEGCYTYDVQGPGWKLQNLRLQMGGQHNVENSVAAIAIAHRLGISDEKIRQAVASFRGVRRRFEFIIQRREQVYVDDYAHHPEELRALISGARQMFPGRYCVVAFQPHLYTRTRDLAEGFAESLSLADQVLLLPIYPAREEPIAGVSSALIGDLLTTPWKHCGTQQELLEWINDNKPSLLLTAGAGDIDRLVEPIREILSKT